MCAHDIVSWTDALYHKLGLRLLKPLDVAAALDNLAFQAHMLNGDYGTHNAVLQIEMKY